MNAMHSAATQHAHGASPGGSVSCVLMYFGSVRWQGHEQSVSRPLRQVMAGAVSLGTDRQGQRGFAAKDAGRRPVMHVSFCRLHRAIAAFLALSSTLQMKAMRQCGNAAMRAQASIARTWPAPSVCRFELPRPGSPYFSATTCQRAQATARHATDRNSIALLPRAKASAFASPQQCSSRAGVLTPCGAPAR